MYIEEPLYVVYMNLNLLNTKGKKSIDFPYSNTVLKAKQIIKLLY